MLAACTSLQKNAKNETPRNEPPRQVQRDEAIELTEHLLEQLENSGIIANMPEAEKISQEILERLAKDFDPKPRIRYLRNSSPNSMALADGTICINLGLLALLSNQDQLAFIIAHELGHLKNRHIIKRISTTVNTGIFSTMLDTFITPLIPGNLYQLLSDSLIDDLPEIFLSAHSRELEWEADQEALPLLEQAGFNLTNAIESFLIYQDIENQLGLTDKSLVFSTHPSIKARLERSEKYLKDRSLKTPEAPTKDPLFIQSTAELRLKSARWSRRAGRYFEALNKLALLEETKLDKTELLLEEAETYRRMVEEFGRAKRSVTKKWWSEKYGTADNKKIRTLWQKLALNRYNEILQQSPANLKALRGRGLLYSFYSDEQGLHDLLHYLELDPKAPDNDFIKGLITETYQDVSP